MLRASNALGPSIGPGCYDRYTTYTTLFRVQGSCARAPIRGERTFEESRIDNLQAFRPEESINQTKKIYTQEVLYPERASKI